MWNVVGRALGAPGRIISAILELKNEATGTRKVIIAAILMITGALAGLSICGAFATTSGDGWAWVPRLIYAMLVLGLETLAAVLFMRAMLAGDRPRAIVCLVALPLLVWANVQNAKDGVHFIMPDRFAETSGTLNAKADLAAEEAATLATAQQAAIGGTGAELERVRTQIAELRTEQQIMASMSPEGIEKAQSLLLAQGLYFGSVDGIRQDKTESAMRARGEAIQGELATLKAREDGLMAGQTSPVQKANTDKRLEEIAIRAKAQAAAEAAMRTEVILWISEFARNFLLWAAGTAVTAAVLSRGRNREEELLDAEHQAKLAAIRASMTPAAPTPVAPPPEPALAPAPEPVVAIEPPAEPAPPPPPEQRSDASQRARDAAKTLAKMNRADKLENVILVNDNRQRNADRAAMKVAAQ